MPNWDQLEVERQANAIQGDLARRPLRLPPPPPTYQLILIGGGNTVNSQSGIATVYPSVLTSIPTKYDPSASPSTVNGIGWGYMQQGPLAGQYVLVVNDVRSSFGFFLFANQTVWTGAPISVPVAGGGSVQAFIAG